MKITAAKTLAYYARELITAVKCFIVESPGLNKTVFRPFKYGKTYLFLDAEADTFKLFYRAVVS
jgi:hypothetical protein